MLIAAINLGDGVVVAVVVVVVGQCVVWVLVVVWVGGGVAGHIKCV